MIVEINEAYDVLGNENKRSDYDEKLGLKCPVRPRRDPFSPFDDGHDTTYTHSPGHTSKRRGPTVGGHHRPQWTNSYTSTEELHRKYQEAMRRDEEEWDRRRSEFDDAADEKMRRRHQQRRDFMHESARNREMFFRQKLLQLSALFCGLMMLFSAIERRE